MKIKDGFDSKELSIEINGNRNGHSELWIKMSGLPDEKYREMLCYMTLDELRELKEEIDSAIKDIFNL